MIYIRIISTKHILLFYSIGIRGTCNLNSIFLYSTARTSLSLNSWSSEEVVIEHVMLSDIKERLRGRGSFKGFYFCDTGELVGFTKPSP